MALKQPDISIADSRPQDGETLVIPSPAPPADTAGDAGLIEHDGGVERLIQVQPGPFGAMLAFAEALQRRDPGAAYSRLEPGARVLTEMHTEVSDPESVGLVLAKLTSPDSRLDVTPGRTLVKDDLALCTQAWRLRPAGESPCYHRANSAYFVLHRSGVRWQIAIAAPWG